MKAVCLLLCLALVRLGAGSIFHRRHYPTMETFAASEDYIDPYLQAEQYQLEQYRQQQQYQRQHLQQKQDERHHHQREAQLNQEQPQQVYQQNEVYAPQYPVYSNQQNEGNNKLQQANRQMYRQEQDQHKKYYQTKDQNQEQQVYNQKQWATNQEQRVSNQGQERRQEQSIRRFGDSSSIETGSQETIQNQHVLTGNQYEMYAAPRFADLDTPVVFSRAAEQMPAVYGDAVEWRGLKVASSPSSPVNKKDIEKIFRSAQMATKHIQPEAKTKLHEAVEAAQVNSEDTYMNATELLKKNNYPVEEHTIKTEDGYYLTLFRIPPKQQSSEEEPKKVVFLMHGLLGSADDWLLMGPGKSLAYLLSDAGYDVYLGNARGNRYTHHASKHRAQSDFWQYSNDEIALYDLPAMIDYVLKVSNQQKMFYVGHSLGTTAFFALASARPEYNDKIEMMYALSPMVYMAGVRSPLVRMIAPSSVFSERLYSQLGRGQFKPNRELIHTIGGAMCENEIGCKKMCSNVYFVMSGMNVEHLEPKQISSIMSHLPAGGSTKQMKQYGQAVDSEDFRMYDYGSEMNKKVYGQSQPPKYNMEKVTAPVVLYYSEHDWLAHPSDVERLRKELPNATAHKIPQDYFSHIDFQYSKQAPEMVNKKLIESIQNEQNNEQQQRANEQDQ